MTKTADALGGFLLYNVCMSDKIKRVKITELQPDPNNLNQHTQRGHTIVENSMRRRGIGRGILAAGKGVDNPVVLAGNLTLEKAVDAGFENVILVHTTGKDLVVNVRDDIAPNSAEAIALAIEDNESSKQSYNSDVEVLAALAQGENAVLAALRNEDKILNSVIEGIGLPDENAGADTEPEISRADELREKWQTATGQLWQLGRHRLLCGDSTKREDVERVMGGEKCETLLFDPEWDECYTTHPKYESAIVFSDGGRISDCIRLFGAPTWLFVWDCVSSWYTPNRPLKRIKICLWYGAIESYNFDGWHYGDSGMARDVRNSRGSYKFTPDPRRKHLSDLFSLPISKFHAESEHNHSKPIDWVTMLIANCTRGIVYDPFGGSGTALIACENLNRDCRMIEISPAYCAVILERWAAHTGGTPELME